MSNPIQSLEEAANIASEYIYSLDNLPQEVNHILQEIKLKDLKSQEIQQEIDRDASRYIRHSIKASNSLPSSPSSLAPSPKDSIIPGRIDAAFIDMDKLALEKCALAQTLIELISRARSRLDSDFARVRYLQGDAIDYTLALGTSYTSLNGPGIADGTPALQIGESVRSVLTAASAIPDIKASASASQAGIVVNAYKKRRLTTTSSIKLSSSPTKHRSASPTTTAPLITSQRTASRLSRQVTARRESEFEDEAEEDVEGEDMDAEDERLYCFCQKQSYGDMIACDNEGQCPYEWFHLSCVGMKQPTPEKWYCDTCLSSMNRKATGATKKGRKK